MVQSIEMRIPLTRYGLPQVATFPLVIVAIMAFCYFVALRYCCGWICTAIWIREGLLAVLLVWVLSFFRDPERNVPAERNVLVAPADGTVTDVERLENCEYMQGAVIKIGIFLSVLNVHINRAPCAAVVEEVRYKKGKFRDARNPASSKVNESNDLMMRQVEEPKDTIVVRQISGAIARRIVCEAAAGSRLAAGERFGMIKFGSRTELYVPGRTNARCVVAVGDKVKAGSDILVRYE